MCWEPRRLGWALAGLDALQAFEARARSRYDGGIQPVLVVGSLSG